jgi:ABC-type Fe3+/spermidine/putrescine transport system ATPase subunit
MADVLRITALTHTFNGIPALDQLSLTLEQGERVAVLGPSGSGKTTLLRLIAGLDAPQQGEIAIGGMLASRAGTVLVPPERRDVALVFQGLALFPHLTAVDQIGFAARHRGGDAHARLLLDRIGLGHRATARLDQLSGGERQRIALARALAQQPRLILMDEPFASLDDDKRADMRDLLRSLLASSGVTLVLVTHARDDALDLAQRVLILERGRTVACDRIETVLSDPRHPASVRALGLGQILDGEASGPGQALTAFGTVTTRGEKPHGRIQILVRPGQPRLVGSDAGVEATVVSIAVRPSETSAVQRIAVVRAQGTLLRVRLAGDQALSAGASIHIRIDGDCPVLAG